MGKWVVIVFEGEHAQFDHEVAYVKGPFASFEQATAWAENARDCIDGKWQVTFIEAGL